MHQENKLVKVSSLVVNCDNPRINPVKNEVEAIQSLIDLSRQKFYNLAVDISEKWLDPSSNPIVTMNSMGQYLVLDGNRRVAAVKMLNGAVNLDQKYSGIVNKINELDKSKVKSSVHVSVFSSVDDANHWIRLKHTGENNGVGTLSWNATQISRFDETKYPYSHHFITELIARNYFRPNDFYSEIHPFPISSLERVLGDPDFRKILNLSAARGQLNFPPENGGNFDLLSKMLINDLLGRHITVDEIKGKVDREKYAEQLVSRCGLGKTKAKQTKRKAEGSTVAKIDESEPLDLNIIKKPSHTTQRYKAKKTKIFESTQERQYLIPISCHLSIAEHKINDIYRQMQSKVNVNEAPDVVACALRVFLELSLNYYLDYTGVSYRENLTLNKKFQLTKDNISKNPQLDSDVISSANKVIASGKDSLISINTLHAYLHNNIYQADPNNLKATWNNLQPFFVELFSLVEKSSVE